MRHSTPLSSTVSSSSVSGHDRIEESRVPLSIDPSQLESELTELSYCSRSHNSGTGESELAVLWESSSDRPTKNGSHDPLPIQIQSQKGQAK